MEIRKPIHVVVDKRTEKSKWRLGVIYDPRFPRVHLMSYKHKKDAQIAGHAVAKAFKIPVTIYTKSKNPFNSETKDYSDTDTKP